MFTSAITFLILLSCSKEVPETFEVAGSWNLIQKDLYTNDTLTTSIQPDENSVIYSFDHCQPSHGNDCQMYIEEDGEQRFYAYQFFPEANQIILDYNSQFDVELLDQNNLTLSRSYDNYRSVYKFVRMF